MSGQKKFDLDLGKLVKDTSNLSDNVLVKMDLTRDDLSGAVAGEPEAVMKVYRACISYPVEKAISEWFGEIGGEDLDMIPEGFWKSYVEWKKEHTLS